ncbi:unnamed protein product [Sphagnum balticum]
MHAERLREQLENAAMQARAASVYHAKPVPKSILGKPFQPRPTSLSLTEPVGFDLASSFRHEEAETRFQRSKEESVMKQMLESTFKAKPLLARHTFRVKVSINSDEDLVTPVDVHFHSDDRIQRRHQLRNEMEDKQKQIVTEQKKLENFILESEKKELRELRAKSIAEGGMSFVARPILTVDPFPCSTISHLANMDAQKPSELLRQEQDAGVAARALPPIHARQAARDRYRESAATPRRILLRSSN